MTSAALPRESLLAPVDVMRSALLNFLDVMAWIADVLPAEWANHKLGSFTRWTGRTNTRTGLQAWRGRRLPAAGGHGSQLRCVTRSLRDPEAACLRRLDFFQEGLMRALRAMGISYGL
jgi:hypothetical protein